MKWVPPGRWRCAPSSSSMRHPSSPSAGVLWRVWGRAITRREGAGIHDVVAARAVASLAVLVEYAAPLLVVGGYLVAWKGARDTVEESAGSRAAAAVGLEPSQVVPVEPYPGSRAHHLHLYV